MFQQERPISFVSDFVLNNQTLLPEISRVCATFNGCWVRVDRQGRFSGQFGFQRPMCRNVEVIEDDPAESSVLNYFYCFLYLD